MGQAPACSKRPTHDQEDHEDQAEETDSSDVTPWHTDKAKPKKNDGYEGARLEEIGQRGCREKIHEGRTAGSDEDNLP